jgi:hypothetical protein
MVRPVKAAATATALLLFTFVPAWAQPYRDNLPLPSIEINRQLMTYAQAKDFEKISRTLTMVKPLTDALKKKFVSDVESELRSGLKAQDQDRIVKATQRLVYLDLKDLMDLAVELMGESNDKAKTKMKAAYLDYLLLSPYIEKLNFSSDQKIKKHFRSANLALDASVAYGGEKAIASAVAGSAEDIKRLVDEIDKELTTTLAFSK